jgi:cAMP-dependent protein kinase regulator
LREERHKAGEIVIREGDKGDKFYLVLEGEAHAFLSESPAQQVLRTYRPGDYFGEVALLKNVPR